MTENDLMLTAEERRERQRKRRRWFVVALSLILSLAFGLLSARPVRHSIQRWQARRHAERAFVFIDQAKWREARDEATAAYQLRSDEPQALRAIALLLSRANEPYALIFWKKLKAIEPLTQTDLRDEATIAIKTNDLTVAEEAVQQLLKNDKGKPTAADWLLAADVCGKRNEYDKASQLAEKALAERQLTRREEFQAVFILETVMRNVGSNLMPDPKQIDDRMASLAKGNDDVALDALIVLSQYVPATTAGNNPTPLSVDELIERINNHPLAKVSQKLLGADLEIWRRSDQRAQIEQREFDRWKNSSNEDLAVLGAWLHHHGEYQRALEAIPTERAVQSRDLFLQRVDTLGALGRWRDVKQLLEDERSPLEPVVQTMYLARCNAQLGEKAAAENNWKRALEAAVGDIGKLITLADYAEKNGIVDVAGSAYEEAVVEAPELWIVQQGRLRIAQRSGDTKRIHAILVDMLRLRSNDAAVQNEEAYTRLLLLPTDARPDSSELKSIEAIAQKLLQAEPTSLPHRTLLGLVFLKENRPQEALALYNGLNVPQKELTPSTVAVHSAILAANGRDADARTEISHLPLNKILPEERALIDRR